MINLTHLKFPWRHMRRINDLDTAKVVQSGRRPNKPFPRLPGFGQQVVDPFPFFLVGFDFPDEFSHFAD